MMDRRAFLAETFGSAVLSSLPADLLAQAGSPPPVTAWDAGRVRHLLPGVNATRMLIKASFNQPLTASPTLRIGATAVQGRATDTRREFWQFDASGLETGRRYTLSLSSNGRTLCEPWSLSTLPAPEARPAQCRVLFFTCAGGHDAMGFLPAATRNRLLRRALSFQPDLAVANGDHVYWDLLAPRASPGLGASPEAARLAGRFTRSAVVFGGTNETVLRRAVDPQIVSVYGTDLRSTPVFFLQDDHDYFENDEATADIITFPPSWFMLQLARATQRLYYPEFLPDPTRPASLPWSSADDRPAGVSETFGTLRYGRLLEAALYDVRRTMTLAGPSAVFVDLEAERWLRGRAAAEDVTHFVHVPSNPPGWSAGKWGEWYPDVLGADKVLTTKIAKPYWQEGWLAQHDRLMASLSAMRRRVPLVVSGDLHALARGRMLRSGALDFTANPINIVLSGPMGTNAALWPSAFRGVGATPPTHLDMREDLPPLEQHGFTIADFLPDRVHLRLFKWDLKTQSPDAIDRLEPFHTADIQRTA
jgi:hypothetical protein